MKGREHEAEPRVPAKPFTYTGEKGRGPPLPSPQKALNPKVGVETADINPRVRRKHINFKVGSGEGQSRDQAMEEYVGSAQGGSDPAQQDLPTPRDLLHTNFRSFRYPFLTFLLRVLYLLSFLSRALYLLSFFSPPRVGNLITFFSETCLQLFIVLSAAVL